MKKGFTYNQRNLWLDVKTGKCQNNGSAWKKERKQTNKSVRVNNRGHETSPLGGGDLQPFAKRLAVPDLDDLKQTKQNEPNCRV